MSLRWRPGMFAVVAALAIGAVVFRVATAPDRVKARKTTARASCVALGGSWVLDGRDEICRKPQQNAQWARRSLAKPSVI